MGRSPNGHAKPYLGADGRWHLYLTIGTLPDGRPHRKHIARNTAGACADEAKRVRERIARGGTVTGKIETVADWLTYWLNDVVEPRLRYGTVKQYRAVITHHLVPSIGRWRLDGSRTRLEPEHLEAAYATMRRRGLSDSYVHAAHVIVKKALKDAMRRGKTSRNVADMIDPPKPGSTEITAHTLGDVEKILAAAMSDREPARWLIAMLLGLRQGEVLALRWHRVRLDADPPVLSVDKQLQRQRWEHGCGADRPCGRRFGAGCPARHGGGLVEVDVKTAKSRRDVPLPAVIVDELRRTRERQIVRCADLGVGWDPRGFVFTNEQGRVVSPEADHRAWERLLRGAGVDDTRLHAARHSAGTYLVATGTDISLVGAVLGHSRLAVTERYVHPAEGLKREAVDRLAAAMFQRDVTALLQGPKVSGPTPS